MIEIMLETLFPGIEGARVAAFKVGAAIFRQDAPVHSLFQVRSGKVALVRHLVDGGVVTLASAGPGESFAEASLFADRYHCDAVVRSDCELLVIPVAAVRMRLDADPKLARDLAAFFARQVRELRSRIEVQRVKRAPDRLLAWLRLRAQGSPPTIAAPGAWAHIASEIGLTPEALYRALRTLEKAGRIERNGRASVVLKREPRR